MNPFQTKKFKELQQYWYNKLKESGFEEIENTEHKDEFLKVWHSSYFQLRHDPESFDAKKEYYDKARQFLQSTYINVQYNLFSAPTEDAVWELHSEGHSLRDIAKKLNMKKSRVETIVNNLKKQMIGSK